MEGFDDACQYAVNAYSVAAHCWYCGLSVFVKVGYAHALGVFFAKLKDVAKLVALCCVVLATAARCAAGVALFCGANVCVDPCCKVAAWFNML